MCVCVCVCVYIYIYIYIYLNHFAVFLKLTQHCTSTILQLKKEYFFQDNFKCQLSLQIFIETMELSGNFSQRQREHTKDLTIFC